jgi:DNA-directed RNA polymerase specialized sigma24 family protein
MQFPNTEPGLFAIASMNRGKRGIAALNELCTRYQEPLRRFLHRRLGGGENRLEDAEDTTQDILMMSVELRLWQQFDPAIGRFRSLLLAVAEHYLSNWMKAERALKRGGGKVKVSLDDLLANGWEPVDPESDAALEFDRQWAAGTMKQAMETVESQTRGKPDKLRRLEVLRLFLPGNGVPPTFEEAAALLGTSAVNMRMLLHRFRLQIRTAVLAALGDTVANPEDAREEYLHLQKVMALEPPGMPEKTANDS